MHPIQSPQDLLVHLAGSGDPSAFYTLVGPCARATYTNLRKHGKSHAEAITVLVPFLKKIHKNYLATGSRNVPFGAWYETQRARLLPDGGDTQDEKALPETIPSADLSDFESQTRLAFQQTYHNLVVAGKGSKIRRSDSTPFLAILGAVALGVLIVFLGLQIYGAFAGFTISLSLSSTGGCRAVAKPSAEHKAPVSNAALQTPPATTPAASASGTTAQPQKARPQDSISVPAPVKKLSSPRRVARTAPSPGISAADAPANPLSDSATANSRQGLPEKSAPAAEKSSVSPSIQAKQPAALPESSSSEP